MKKSTEQYEMVIGLEVHAELKTKTKIFCGCAAEFGAAQNTQCCPICLGMPGTLPVLNRKVVEYAVKAGLACECKIARKTHLDRKNYFYPDLPKAYQISQYDKPLCYDGHLDINCELGKKRIGITRIHIEEDAGKLIHENGTAVDCNRCGVPLIEIVSEPDLRSAEEAKEYVKKLRSVLVYTNVSDCKMNEGSLRCDVNLSVRKKGETTFGVRTEMKNINSFQFIGKAIEYEFARQVDVLESGEPVIQETRRFDEHTGKTYSMRSKEQANDYCFFPEPDLPPIQLDEAIIEQWEAEIPTLPDERKARYQKEYGLSAASAEILCASLQTAEYFEQVCEKVSDQKAAADFMQSQLLTRSEKIPIAPKKFAEICNLLSDEVISNAAARKVIAAVWEQDCDVLEYVKTHELQQISDLGIITEWVQETIDSDQKSVAAFLSGKSAAAQALIGKAIKKSAGKGNPRLIREVVLQQLQQMETEIK